MSTRLGEEQALLTVEIGIAKTNKYASRESGDTAEVVERPGGGLSVVLVDGQGSGGAAKLLSNALAGKAIAMLKDGVRDGAVARATHDYLHHYRSGQVSATLDIVSVDLVSRTLVVTRNSTSPMIVLDDRGITLQTSNANPIGPARLSRPEIHQFPVVAGLRLVVFTDGIERAGQRSGATWSVAGHLTGPDTTEQTGPEMANAILAAALAADNNRASDDMTVVVVAIAARPDASAPLIRRLTVTLPLDGLMAARN